MSTTKGVEVQFQIRVVQYRDGEQKKKNFVSFFRFTFFLLLFFVLLHLFQYLGLNLNVILFCYFVSFAIPGTVLKVVNTTTLMRVGDVVS